MAELNPNHPVTREVHDHWHKIAALLMLKLGKTTVDITSREIERMAEMPGGCNITIMPKADLNCIRLQLISDEEAKKLVAKEGGLPV